MNSVRWLKITNLSGNTFMSIMRNCPHLQTLMMGTEMVAETSIMLHN
jgi:hypothetical protein